MGARCPKSDEGSLAFSHRTSASSSRCTYILYICIRSAPPPKRWNNIRLVLVPCSPRFPLCTNSDETELDKTSSVTLHPRRHRSPARCCRNTAVLDGSLRNRRPVANIHVWRLRRKRQVTGGKPVDRELRRGTSRQRSFNDLKLEIHDCRHMSPSSWSALSPASCLCA